MTDTTIITANIGGYDDPRPQAEQTPAVRWVYVTDSDEPGPPPWGSVSVARGGDPNLTAKWFKCVAPVATRYAVWIDANMEVTSPTFAQEAVAVLQWDEAPVAVFAHPRRGNVMDEYLASIGAESQGGRYDADQLKRQVDHYVEEGYPISRGSLYACGVVAWDLNHPHAQRLGAAWYDECARWSIQDQLSFPVVCWRLGITPAVFPFPQLERRYPWQPRGHFGNRWLRIHPHRVTSEEKKTR